MASIVLGWLCPHAMEAQEVITPTTPPLRCRMTLLRTPSSNSLMAKVNKLTVQSLMPVTTMAVGRLTALTEAALPSIIPLNLHTTSTTTMLIVRAISFFSNAFLACPSARVTLCADTPYIMISQLSNKENQTLMSNTITLHIVMSILPNPSTTAQGWESQSPQLQLMQNMPLLLSMNPIQPRAKIRTSLCQQRRLRISSWI